MSNINLQINARGTNVAAQRRGNNVVIDIDNHPVEEATERANEAAANIGTTIEDGVNEAVAPLAEQIGTATEAALIAAQAGVRTDTPEQNLSDAQQVNARTNIRAASLRETNPMAYYGAVGDDPERDTEAWLLTVMDAVATGRKIRIVPPENRQPFLITETAYAPLGIDGVLDIQRVGKAVLKLADGAIVNTDADRGNHVAILRTEGGFRVDLDLLVDGNRDGQIYPETMNIFGRGSSPRRWIRDIYAPWRSALPVNHSAPALPEGF